jgi:hypothetical protein
MSSVIANIQSSTHRLRFDIELFPGQDLRINVEFAGGRYKFVQNMSVPAPYTATQ